MAMAYFRKVKAKNKKEYTWSFTIDIGRDPETGKRKQITRRGFESKKDAENAAAQLLLEIEKGEYIQPKPITLKEFMIDWLENVAKQNVKPSTFAVYKRIIPKFGHMKLEQIKPVMITKYYHSLI